MNPKEKLRYLKQNNFKKISGNILQAPWNKEISIMVNNITGEILFHKLVRARTFNVPSSEGTSSIIELVYMTHEEAFNIMSNDFRKFYIYNLDLFKGQK